MNYILPTWPLSTNMFDDKNNINERKLLGSSWKTFNFYAYAWDWFTVQNEDAFTSTPRVYPKCFTERVTNQTHSLPKKKKVPDAPKEVFTSKESTPVVQGLSYTPLYPRFSSIDSGRGRWIFSERKNPEYDFLRKGSKAVGPVS